MLLVLKKERERERERGDSLSLSLSVSQRAPARFFRVEREKKSVLRKARMYYVRFESCKGLLKMNPKMLFFFSNFFFVCVSFFIGFKVSCDTLNTFEKKREVFFLRCHVVCVFIFFIGGVLVLEKRHSRLIDDGFVVVLYYYY